MAKIVSEKKFQMAKYIKNAEIKKCWEISEKKNSKYVLI